MTHNLKLIMTFGSQETQMTSKLRDSNNDK